VQQWFDGHLDLAYLAERGREMARVPRSRGGEGEEGELSPGAVTFPMLAAGHVRGAFATIFVQRRVSAEEALKRDVDPLEGTWCFETTDQAYGASLRQLATYELWDMEGHVRLLGRPGAVPLPKGSRAIKTVLLLEGATGVREMADFRDFYDGGVRIVALCWVEGNKWAGGDQSGGDVTAAGLELIAELDRLGCAHDVSHLSEAAFWTLMGAARGPKMASHSNCRALLPGKAHPERNLSDEQIRALAEAGGIVGINLFSPFLVPAKKPPVRARIADVLTHVKHMEDVVGRRDFLALGSDFDGGYSRTSWAEGLDGPEELPKLAEALSRAGWSDAEVERFAWGNWSGLLTKMGIEV
jgi:membrane dipeptidase